MTDQTTNASEPVQTPNAPPKATKAPKASKSAFSVTDLARARLRKRGIKSDARLTDEAKVVRGILRANFDTIRKTDAAVRKAKDTRNDRKPWPTTMNKSTHDLVVNGKGGKS